LAVVDQLDWLRHYGDPNPLCDLRAESFRRIGEVKIGPHTGVLYEGRGNSHSDVGDRNHRPRLLAIAAFLGAVFNLSNAELHLKASAFMPGRSNRSYESIVLQGFIVVVSVEKGVKAVLFGNGAIHESELGKYTNTFMAMKKELLKTLCDFRITKVD
jgi:hypothetical protein